jgi:hypothetical protein
MFTSVIDTAEGRSFETKTNISIGSHYILSYKDNTVQIGIYNQYYVRNITAS